MKNPAGPQIRDDQKQIDRIDQDQGSVIDSWKFMYCWNGSIKIQAEDKRKGAEIQKEKRRCEIAEPQGILRKIGDAETWQYIRGTGKDEADVAKQKKQIAPLFQVERSDNENKKYYTNDKRTELT